MLTFFIIVILVALGLQWYTLRNAGDYRNIRYECKPSVGACEPGDEFFVLSNVANLGRRSSPALRIEEHFPKNLNVLESDQFNVKWLSKDHRIHYSTVLMHGREQVRRSLRASITQRGEYCFSYADFYAGDFLGFREFNYRMANDSRIVIYPARLDRALLPETFTNALDELARHRQLLEDPISVAGYRDYTGAEPMRQISWKQSAVHGRLIVKQFDPVRQRTAQIALDTSIHGDFDEYLEQLELCFSLARTVCEQLEERSIAYRLTTNAAVGEEIAGLFSSGGMGSEYRKILYALGSAKRGSIASVEELMHAVSFGAGHSEMTVLISTCRNERVENAVNALQKAGRGKVVVLYADQLAAAPGPAEKEEGA